MDRITALTAYVRIVELGSFTAASSDLRLRQATVSRWIAELEEELGAQLLDRTTRSVRVTEAGERFYAHAREVLAAWASAVEQVRALREEVSGRLRVSVPVVFGQRFIAPNVATLLQRHPALELELLFSDRYVDLVEEGVDVALRVGRPVDSAYRARTLGVASRRLVASPAYLDAHGWPADAAALAEHRCLLHAGLNTQETWAFERAGVVTRVDVRGRLRANHSATLLEVARAGQGVALLASWLADEDIAAGRLIHLLPDWAPPLAPVQALFSAARHPSRAAHTFVDFMAELLTDALTPRAL